MTELENLQKYIGKTIKTIDDSAVNCITFTFTDGTSFMLETEYFGIGLYGIGKYEKKETSEQERFVEHLQNATMVVDKWPEWKKNVLGVPITSKE